MNFEAEKTAIQETLADQAAAANRGGRAGAEGYASFAAPDAQWLPPNAPSISGREAIAEYAAEFTGAPGFHMRWEHPYIEVVEGGKLAYSFGTYSGGLDDEDGNHLEMKGKTLNIWKKQPDSSWKIAVAIWNSDEPESQP